MYRAPDRLTHLILDRENLITYLKKLDFLVNFIFLGCIKRNKSNVFVYITLNKILCCFPNNLISLIAHFVLVHETK